jgi:probable HAF family extracellular repeat protein
MRQAAFCTILLTVGMFLAGALPAVAGPLYTCKDLGGLPGSVDNTWAVGLNNAGQVVGHCGTPEGVRAFLYSGGAMQNLGLLPAPYDGASFATGINDAGQVVGYSGPSFDASHGFLYSGGVMHDMGTLPGTPPWHHSRAYAINAAGQVVGSAYDIRFIAVPFLYSGGVMHVLSNKVPPDAGVAYGINTAGQVVGVCQFPSTPGHAFLSSGGGMQDLGTLGTSSTAYAINAAGQVVGESWSSQRGDWATFLYRGGVMYDLMSLVQNLPTGEELLHAYGINDRGQIIASSSHGHSYLLTPIRPLPALDLLLLD